MVLSDFKKFREGNRSRSEYTELLRRDLCTYYSYNDFLMEKLMQMFPLDEVLELLEASEVQRPMTIRTNTLRTRRRDLAEVDLQLYHELNQCYFYIYVIVLKLIFQAIATVFILFETLTKSLYDAVWVKIKELVLDLEKNIQFIMLDYEHTAGASVSEHFPPVSIHGSWFHYYQ